MSSSMPCADAMYCARTGLSSSSAPGSSTQSRPRASTGRTSTARSSTGAVASTALAPSVGRLTVHVAIPMARKQVRVPWPSSAVSLARAMAAARRRASSSAAWSRTSSESRVAVPPSSWLRAPRWARPRSRVPSRWSRNQRSVLGPPSSTSRRFHSARAAVTRASRGGGRPRAAAPRHRPRRPRRGAAPCAPGRSQSLQQANNEGGRAPGGEGVGRRPARADVRRASRRSDVPGW